MLSGGREPVHQVRPPSATEEAACLSLPGELRRPSGTEQAPGRGHSGGSSRPADSAEAVQKVTGEPGARERLQKHPAEEVAQALPGLQPREAPDR